MVVRARVKRHLANGEKSLCTMTEDENLLTLIQDDVTCKICLNIMNNRSATGVVGGRSKPKAVIATVNREPRFWQFYYEPLRIGESIWSDVYSENGPMGRVLVRYGSDPTPDGCKPIDERSAIRFYGQEFVKQLQTAWADGRSDVAKPIAQQRPFIPLGERTVAQIISESRVRSRVMAESKRRAG